MKYSRFIYSHFIANRPEQTTMFEVWCFIGGAINTIIVAFDSDTGFVGIPRLESMLSIILPVLYFFINFLSKEIQWMRGVLFFVIVSGISLNVFLYFYPQVPRLALPISNISLAIFSIIALFFSTGSRKKI